MKHIAIFMTNVHEGSSSFVSVLIFYEKHSSSENMGDILQLKFSNTFS